MKNLLMNFVNETNNALYNFLLGKWYEDNGYTAAGLTFFLRAAEYSDDDTLAYESLLRGFFCYKKQGSRDDSAHILLQNAVAKFPERPEAYFLLSCFYQESEQWQESYIYACLGLNILKDNSHSCLLTDVGYPGKYGLLFQKAMSGYRWGKEQECRKLLQELLYNYDLNELYRSMVVENIHKLGLGSIETMHKEYTENLYDQLKFKFPNSETIEKNFAQAYQDMFVLYVSNGKNNGKYLEIGSGDPKWLNNTYLLEKKFNWHGVGIEINQQLIKEYQAQRNNPIICDNALNINFIELLISIFGEEKNIDYLQLDCDSPEIAYRLLEKIPFETYNFGCITFEHDDYRDIDKQYKDLSRKFLIDKGYQLAISDVSCVDWGSFEDWWINPNMIDKNLFENIKDTNNCIKQIDQHFISSRIKEKLNTNFAIKAKPKPTAIIIDNFYHDPNAVREFALSQEFIDGGFGRGYIGKRTAHQYLFDGLKEKFEAILGQKITSWYEQPMNGRFQITYAGEPLVYHCDIQKWAGMIYLTPDPPFECGTTLYAHKITKARSYNDEGWDYSWKDASLGDVHLDGTFFEPVDVLGNVYNRLVIFDGSNIHAASKYFGQIDTNSRLWHMFFFD